VAPSTAMPQDQRRPFIIYREPPGWGFWSNFAVVLQGLDEADQRHLAPVVDMERYATRYNETEPVNGTMNAWEYYFEQPTALTLAEARTQDPLDSGGVVKEGPFTTAFAQIAPAPATLARGRELIQKYVRIKPGIERHLDSLLTRETGAHCAGVHVRGTDQRHGHFPDHPVSAVPEAYLEQVVMLDKEQSFNRIFLATDEQETVSLFTREFGARLLTIPAHRTSSSVAEANFRQDYTWLFSASDRCRHRYHLGLEVLVDALLLSRCRHLVCGASNVSHAAMYFATEAQRVHPVPPLWLFPDARRPSRGRTYLASLPPPTYQPTTAVLERNLREFQSMVECLENERAQLQSRPVQPAEERPAMGHLDAWVRWLRRLI